MQPLDPYAITLAPAVHDARADGRPIVALESTVIAHGLPYPDNVILADDLERIIRAAGSQPATIGIIGGRPTIGLSPDAVQRLATAPDVWKVGPRDLPIVAGLGLDGATTVAGTLTLAHIAGIRVMSTGGIGGVHVGGHLSLDISADLPALAANPLVVVCSGPKTLVDPALTLEWLETHGVPVIGYRTDTLPLFYLPSSQLPVTRRADTVEEIAAIARASSRLGLSSAILVVNPVPDADALPEEETKRAITTALHECDRQAIHGARLTPYVLARLRDLTAGASLRANLSLLRANAHLAATIATALASPPRA